ncbi:MAG: TRAP transporter substrate-binding protein DctP [Cyanobacteria bacterium J06634_6]
MKRRSFLQDSAKKVALGTTSAALLGACSQTQAVVTPPTTGTSSLPTLQWKMATSWPKKLDILFGGAERLCRRVREMTDGRFSITPYASGELAPGLNVLDVVSAGTVECGHTASYYYVDKNPALAFGTTLPFGLNAAQQNAWLYHGGGLKAIQELYKPFGIINFPAGNTGVQMGGWFRKQIDQPGDLTGLKMRIPGLGGKVMKRLGVDVQVLSADEIAPALLAGTIDAAEWNNPYDDDKIGITKAAPYYYYPGWWEPGATYELQINQAQWDALPIAYKEALKAAAAEINTTMPAEYNAKNGNSLKRLKQGGTQIVPFNQAILTAAYTETTRLYEEYANSSADFRRLYHQWKAFRAQVYSWNRINELSFDQFVMAADD